MSTTPRRLPSPLAFPASGALLLLALQAHSQPVPAKPAPAASGAASAAAAAPVPLRGADIPAETSDVPRPPEWDTARVVQATQDAKKVCTLKALREWLRVECLHRLGAALVAGDPADVKIWAWGRPGAELPWANTKTLNELPRAIVTTRLRRGDARIFELYKLDWTYEGYTWAEPAERIAITWREGKDDPVVIVQ
jgi:hypothetical protein